MNLTISIACHLSAQQVEEYGASLIYLLGQSTSLTVSQGTDEYTVDISNKGLKLLEINLSLHSHHLRSTCTV